jgi:hypothetical protein
MQTTAKCHRDEVPTAVIVTTEKCVEGIQMNWANFLRNQFLQDCTEAQEKGTEFHYAWLLILVALVRWKEPTYYQSMHTSGSHTLARRYTNLWHTTLKRRQIETNIVFFTYLDYITWIVTHTPHILAENNSNI